MPIETLFLEQIDWHPLGIAAEVFIFIYSFCALAIICDSYLILSLETLCVRFAIREDVAGATVLALGSSAPELIISSINTLSGEADLGVGAIIGSGMLAFSLLPGLMALAAGSDLLLKRRPLARDSITYLLAFIALTVFISDGFIELYESIILFSMYVVYVIVVVVSPTMRERMIARKKLQEYRTKLQAAIEAGADRATLEELKAQFLTATERKSFVQQKQSNALVNGSSSKDLMSAFLTAEERLDTPQLVELESPRSADSDVFSDDGSIEPVYDVEDEIRHEAGSMSMRAKAWRLVTGPLQLAFDWTCINCEHTGDKAKYYPLTFIVSFGWVSVFAFLISAVSSRFNVISGLPLSLCGILLVAVGAEIPDGIQSISVARRGWGSMAVANSCGAQITNILVGLGLPWLLANAIGVGEGSRAGFQCDRDANGQLIDASCVSASVDESGHVPWKGVQIREREDALIAAMFQFGILTLFLSLLLVAAVAQGHAKAVLTKRKGMIMMCCYVLAVLAFCLCSQVIVQPATDAQYYAPLD